jgi:di- and tripeptidase
MDDSEPESVDDRQPQSEDGQEEEQQQLQERQDGSIDPKNKCAIGHRVKASRSVLALILDEEFVFAGLQGGDIVVSIELGS